MTVSTAALTLLLFQATVARPADATAESFVRDLYRREAHTTKADREAFAGHRGAEAIYSPSLLALIRRDARATPKGDVGKLDFDPVCSCQDSDGITLEALQIMPTDPSHGRAVVTLFPAGSNQRKVTLKLVLLPQGWRIDDMESNKTPSLRKYPR
jgi:hypothetical protein